MLYSSLYGRLILLTKRNDITHAEIGDCIGIERGAVFARAKRNSRVKPDEISKIEKFFNINFNSINISENNFEKQDNKELDKTAEKFNTRLIMLQEKTALSDKDFANLLNLDIDEYIEYKSGNRKPNLSILLKLKQNFKVSADWLLFGG